VETGKKEPTDPRLPLPRWCFVALAVPTFFMPLVYVSLVLLVIGATLFLETVPELPAWMAATGIAAVYVTFAMWPIYLLWAALSKRLSLREKIEWLVLIVLGNMIAMPMFYILMVRRYLGIEGRTNPRDAAALGAFLGKCKLGRERLSADQLGILRSYCRERRLMKWTMIPVALFGFWLLYVAIVFLPRTCTRTFTGSIFVPERVVIVDKASGSRKELTPDPEQQRLVVLNLLILGSMAGITGATGYFLFLTVVVAACGNRDRRALIRFLQASGDPSADNGRASNGTDSLSGITKPQEVD
jgi:hypothetical protein